MFVIGIPLLLKFNAEIFNTAENLLNTVPEINYPAANEVIETAKNSLAENQQILSFFFQYSWIIIIIIVVVVLFIYARRSVEYPVT
ncbi:MAG: hypothetical protein QXY78_04265 [Thermoplasmata archaeon]